MITFSADDYQYMAQALRLAEQGLFTTMPNPRVGCVIVKDGKVIGEGAHLKAGDPHAEVYAISQAGSAAKGATAYVTLEPCSHTGRTPPCSQALIDAGVLKVIAAMQDPNPKVSGSGLAYLQANGVAVASGLMHAQAEALNPGFIARMTRQLPFVRSKVASSLDGKTALSNGESQWITSPAARQDVQQWRARSCAILTGVGTVLADNPSMTVREIEICRQPLKVVVDSRLNIPSTANILQDGNTLIAFAVPNPEKEAALLRAGAELLFIPNTQEKVCLITLLGHLASREMNEVLVEAGQVLNGALMVHQLIDELLLFYAPMLMGGDGRSLFAMQAFTEMQQAIHLDIIEMRQVGVDIRVRAKPLYKSNVN